MENIRAVMLDMLKTMDASETPGFALTTDGGEKICFSVILV